MSWGEKEGRKLREEAGPGLAWPLDQPGPCPGASLRGWGSRWMVLRMAERSGLGPVRAARAAAGSFCLGKHQLPFPGRAACLSGGTEAWGRPAPRIELCHPGRGRPCALASARPLQPAGTSSLSRPPNPAVQGRGGPEASRMSGASRAGWGPDHRLFRGTVGRSSSRGQRLPVTRPRRAQPCPGLWGPSQPYTPEPCLGGAHGPQLVTSGQRHRGLPPLLPGPAGCWGRGGHALLTPAPALAPRVGQPPGVGTAGLSPPL